MTPRLTRRAHRHLEAIAEYIGERSPASAQRVGSRIWEIIDLLGMFPEMGRKGSLAGTREMAVPGLPYVIVYRISVVDGIVEVLGVYHAAQRRPR